MDYYKMHKVYHKLHILDCWQKARKSRLKGCWIDTDRGDRYCSRCVAKQFKGSDADEWFAATPPLEALRDIQSAAATGKKKKGFMVNDVSRAFFYAPAQHDIYVELCEEDMSASETGTNTPS